MEKVTRRAFIGGVGAILATGAMAMSGCAPKDDAKQAELSATGSDQPEATVPDETLEFDIAVVGAGCSGLAACVQAAESGASVICIEAKSIAGGAAGGVEGSVRREFPDSERSKHHGVHGRDDSHRA